MDIEKTYENWLAGYFTGNPAQIGFEATEIEKILRDQKAIIKYKVNDHFNKLIKEYQQKAA